MIDTSHVHTLTMGGGNLWPETCGVVSENEYGNKHLYHTGKPVDINNLWHVFDGVNLMTDTRLTTWQTI